MAGRSTYVAFVRASNKRLTLDTGRMVKPRGTGTTAPASRGGAVT
jgi:hypothetical protein